MGPHKPEAEMKNLAASEAVRLHLDAVGLHVDGHKGDEAFGQQLANNLAHAAKAQNEHMVSQLLHLT